MYATCLNGKKADGDNKWWNISASHLWVLHLLLTSCFLLSAADIAPAWARPTDLKRCGKFISWDHWGLGLGSTKRENDPNIFLCYFSYRYK